MATSGTIYGSTYKSNGAGSSVYEFKASWKRNSYSIEKNTSNITVSLSVRRTDGYSSSAYNLEQKP